MNTQQHSNGQIIRIEDARRELTINHNDGALSTSTQPLTPVEHEGQLYLGDIFKSIKRYKKTVFFITFLVFSSVFVYTLLKTPIYRAEASIIIDQESNTLEGFNVYEKKAEDRNFYKTQYDVLKSRALAMRVITKLELQEYFSQPPKEKSVLKGYLEEATVFLKTTISQVTGKPITKTAPTNDDVVQPAELQFLENLTLDHGESNIVIIKYDLPDAKIASSIANTIAQEYIAMNIDAKSNTTSYASEYLQKQVKEAKSKLDKSEAALVKYAKNKKIINVNNNGSVESTSLLVLTQAYAEAQQRLIQTESAYKQRGQSSGEIRLMNNNVIQSLKARLSELKSTYTEKSQIYKPNYPLMIELKKQIASLNRQIQAEKAIIRSGSTNDLRTQYLAAKDNERKLRAELGRKKGAALSMQGKEVGYQALLRETIANRELHNTLSKKLNELGVAKGMISNNVNIVDKAFIPTTPHTPIIWLNLFLGGFIGLILGILSALIRDRMNDKIKTTEDIETHTGLAVIGVFPHVSSLIKKNTALLTSKKPDPRVSEAFRSTLVDLNYAMEEGRPKLLHITSSAPHEGKTSTIINIAVSMAQEGKKVIVIDCDMRKPALHQYLKAKNTEGLSHILAGAVKLDDVIHTYDNMPNLQFITAGVCPTNPVKLLASDTMLDLLEVLDSKFDQILIDSPPVLGMADALILSNRADATLFVVSSGESRKSHINDALIRIKRSYGNVIGAILTKAKSVNSNSYNYDNYYGYGNRDTVDLEPAKLLTSQE